MKENYNLSIYYNSGCSEEKYLERKDQNIFNYQQKNATYLKLW